MDRFGRKYVVLAAALALVAGCTTVTPNDVGSPQARFDRNTALTGEPVLVQPIAPAGATITPAPAVQTTPLDNNGLTPFTPEENAAANQPVANNSVISDEQNFDAVADRESIESDAARIAANRQQYQVIQPTALPTRSGSAPNIVAYALQTNHPVGIKLYSRIGINKANRAARNCAQYASSDLAQQDFLARGGPDRDRLGIDPDGDGYACKWDPAPFRLARAAPVVAAEPVLVPVQ